MGDKTAIEWTDATWNPIRARLLSEPSRIGWHCEHASPGCLNCYAETLNRAGRSEFTGTRLPYKPGHRKDVEIYLDEKKLLEPLRWRRPRKIFPCSMTDMFGSFVPDAMIDKMFAVMAMCPQHIFQPLTKRAKRMNAYMRTRHRFADILDRASYLNVSQQQMVTAHMSGWPAHNVWLGVSVEDQQRADERIPLLLDTPAAVRWLSMEPMLGPVTFEGRFLNHPNPAVHVNWLELLNWIVVGGESGPKARPMHPDWARSIRDQCAAAGVPMLFKQWGEWSPERPALYHALSSRRYSHDSVGMFADGARYNAREPDGMLRADYQMMYKVGKRAAGRLLDGVEHNGFPEMGN